MPDRPIILTCAVIGSLHTPTMSPHFLLRPNEIAEHAIAAVAAGALIIHLHACNPADERPAADQDVFKRLLPVIKQRTDRVLNNSTGAELG